MLDITHFGLFALSVLLLSITPGPDIAYVVGQSVANGRRAGVISAAGGGVRKLYPCGCQRGRSHRVNRRLSADVHRD